jgi:phage-related protein (TIGR01555 family)
MVKRMESVKLLQSIVSDKIIDSEDDYQFLSTNFAGFPDIQDRALQIMCAIADIPATRFLGQSPGGLNSTGESDLRNYYDAVATHQTMDIDPLIDPLMDAVVLSALGTNGDEIDYVWNSLWQMSETEAATVEKSYADGLAVRVNTGLFDNAILAKTELNRMTDSGKYPGIDAAIKASGEEDGILDPEEAEAKEIEKMTMEAEIAAKNAPKPAPGGFPPKKK